MAGRPPKMSLPGREGGRPGDGETVTAAESLVDQRGPYLGNPFPGETELGVGGKVSAEIPVAPPEPALFGLGPGGANPVAARHHVAVDASAELTEVDAHPGPLGEGVGHLHLLDDGRRSARIGVSWLAVVALKEGVSLGE